jgi:uncharacterized membrane protein
MNTRIALVLDWLRTSFWFLPAAMAFGAAVLSMVSLTLDEAVKDSTVASAAWIYGGGAEGARALLSTVAGSMITVAGVVFSITIVALTLAASQFGPRLLRTFMRDRGNQIVLGAFLSTYLYCLLVLRTIRSGADQEVVPHLSVTLALLLAVLSLGVLIYFVHHVSASIQASNLIAAVSGELTLAIDRLFPECLGEEADATQQDVPTTASPDHLANSGGGVTAAASGYIQALDNDALLRLARTHDILVRLERRPGHFVADGTLLATVWPASKLDEALGWRIRKSFVTGPERTPTQDVEFAIDQLVEIAVRALSPGLNDPFTAMTCLDRLGDALVRLAGRRIPSPYRLEGDKLRIIAEPVTFAGVANAAFNQIRQYGRSSVAVTIRLLETIGQVAEHARRQEDLSVLRRHAEMVLRGVAGWPEANDRADAEQRGQQVLAILDRS